MTPQLQRSPKNNTRAFRALSLAFFNLKLYQMSYLEGDKCRICGSPITDTNPDGIGFGCRNNVVKPAKRVCFKIVKSLDLYIAKVNLVKPVFLEEFAGVKFRSEFKKGFYASMQSAERVSAKQLQIMCDWLFYKRIAFDFWEEVEKPMYDAFNPEFECPELYSEKINIFKIQYLSSKPANEKVEA